MAAASFMLVLQLHKDVPEAAKFYSQGLDFALTVCTHAISKKGYSSFLSFTVTDINSIVSKLMALGAELDGPIKYEIHGKLAAMRCMDGHVLGLHEPAQLIQMIHSQLLQL